ncbi:MAG: flavodoxin-dependent (E)-4-hydroxy-3-methylbut-2-enyl-diphosphate synthase, partial [Calditrichaeota bacterium]|nr:flavodoxin-dependent (E)-4-hydroxy-3-methylbut-2-enyl-diphosphate synthase [Calditrichota bacterium]
QVILTITGEASVAKYRILADLFPNNPILISSPWSIIDNESFLLQYSTLCGSLLCDGIGDGLILSSTNSPAFQLQAAFDMLQACRVRLSKTEFISCPSCGRTLFDLEETTAKVKAKTGHLKGLKIAVMGCIVNGPGEMADADFGYVGAGPGKINLYVGKELVKRNIQSSQAVDELVSLIKQEDKWVEAEHE